MTVVNPPCWLLVRALLVVCAARSVVVVSPLPLRVVGCSVTVVVGSLPLRLVACIVTVVVGSLPLRLVADSVTVTVAGRLELIV